VRWIIDLDPRFPSAAEIAGLVDAVIVTAEDALVGRWPDVTPPAVGYGTMRTMVRLARHPVLGGAVFDRHELLRCSSYLRRVYERLGRVAVILPIAALPHARLDRLFGERVFVRPDANFKLFAARVIETAAARAFVDEVGVHADELCVVSEVVELGAEYRCLYARGRLVGSSSYPDEPYRAAPDDVVAFASEVAASLPEIPMITVDVAAGDRLRLVEIGGVNSWGLYGIDRRAFVEEMEATARLLHSLGT
jgi:hypothetical protein